MVGPLKSSVAIPKAKLTLKWSWPLFFEALLWSAKLSESQRNRGSKKYAPTARMRQQEKPTSLYSNVQPYITTNASQMNDFGSQVLLIHWPDFLGINNHFFEHLNNFLKEKPIENIFHKYIDS